MEGIGFSQFLTWLVFGGGSVMASSWLLERWAWFQGQTSKVKEYATFVGAGVMSIGAMSVMTFAPDFVAKAEPFFVVLAGVFSLVFLKNAFHRTSKQDTQSRLLEDEGLG